MFSKCFATIVLTLAAVVAAPQVAPAAQLFGGAQVGYSGGASGQAYLQLSSFAEQLPLDIRLALEYTSREPGEPFDARHVFINDANNGTPQESGWAWTWRFDLAYRLNSAPTPGLYAYGGIRRSHFTSNFKFVGGNEDFDVTTDQWGAGLGLESRFAMSGRTDFVMGGGFDYFAEGTMSGHDTSYAPDGDPVNGREDYVYEDADESINQPEFVLRAMLGVNYRFGQ